MAHTLYFVRYGDELNNFDLFVVADYPSQAVEFWQEYYETREAFPDSIHNVTMTNAPCGAIAWDKIPAYNVVAPVDGKPFDIVIATEST